MTAYKPEFPIYNPDKDDRPLIVSIGCELSTREQIETDCHRLVPADTRIVFIEAPYSIVYTKNGGANYKEIKQLLRERGYGASWVLHSVWTACDDNPF